MCIRDRSNGAFFASGSYTGAQIKIGTKQLISGALRTNPTITLSLPRPEVLRGNIAVELTSMAMIGSAGVACNVADTTGLNTGQVYGLRMQNGRYIEFDAEL